MMMMYCFFLRFTGKFPYVADTQQRRPLHSAGNFFSIFWGIERPAPCEDVEPNLIAASLPCPKD